NEEARRAYIRARSLWNSRKDGDEILAAIGQFDQAIALDPSFAEAYAARAECRILSSPNVLYGSLDATDAMNKATFDARKAIEINPLLPAAHAALANIDLKFNWDWNEAE